MHTHRKTKRPRRRWAGLEERDRFFTLGMPWAQLLHYFSGFHPDEASPTLMENVILTNDLDSRNRKNMHDACVIRAAYAFLCTGVTGACLSDWKRHVAGARQRGIWSTAVLQAPGRPAGTPFHRPGLKHHVHQEFHPRQRDRQSEAAPANQWRCSQESLQCGFAHDQCGRKEQQAAHAEICRWRIGRVCLSSDWRTDLSQLSASERHPV